MIWKLDAGNVSDRFCLYGSCFSPAFTRWLRNFLKSGGVIIDSDAEEIHAGHSTTRMGWHRGKENRLIEITVLSLDDYAETNGISHIRFWKIDVEGAEWKVIRGARYLLESSCVDAIFCEISSDNRTSVPDFPGNFGYAACKPGITGVLRRITNLNNQERDVLFLSNRVLND